MAILKMEENNDDPKSGCLENENADELIEKVHGMSAIDSNVMC